MTVSFAPAPLIVTLTSIVTPPAYVPGAIMIVSPSPAASTAAWGADKHPGLPPTQRDLPPADGAALAPPTAMASATPTATSATQTNRARTRDLIPASPLPRKVPAEDGPATILGPSYGGSLIPP